MNKKVTIEDLAELCQTEFTAIHREIKGVESGLQGEIQSVRSKLEEHDKQFDTLHDELKGVRTDIREIKMTLNPFVRAVAEMQEDMQELHRRVASLEQHVGLAH